MKKLNWFDLLNSKERVTVMFEKWIRLVRDFVCNIANIPEKNKKDVLLYQTKWPPIQDTRIKSQVLQNKPKHLVKKVIR